MGHLAECCVPFAGALATEVNQRHIGDETCPFPARLDAQCVVGVLEVGGVVMAVEATDRQVVGPPDEPARGRGVVDVTAEDVGAVDGHDVVAADRRRERVGENQLSGFLQRAVAVEEHRRCDADGGIVECRHQRLEPTVPDDDVRVEETEVVAARLLDAELVTAGEAEVVVDGVEVDIISVGEQERRPCCRIRRQAVDHDHLMGDRRVLRDGVEHVEHDRARAVGDDDDRDAWGGLTGHRGITIRSGRHPSRR